MYPLLDNIATPKDLRNLSKQQLPELAEEARDFILDVVSTKAGHLGASLGVMELTIALHYYFDTPKDRLIWDVGHQAYAHKLLTGRKSDFDTLRQWKGMSGFPVIDESPYDTFGVGHSSTSISAITGMALAHRIKGNSYKHIAVIGDASIVSGMAFEGLNHLGDTNLDVLIILNDNNIGIDPAVGALQKHFNDIENSTEADFFETLGFHYHGLIDGHNFDELFHAFDDLKDIEGPKLLHIRTIKGKGYTLAEQNQVLWHAPGKFDKSTGILEPKENILTYQQVVGETLTELFSNDSSFVAITPAMTTGSGLVDLKTHFPERVLDVGIAEQHAVTLAAGLATQGVTPYCVIYSTFLQRAYDQVIHDVALQNLPVVFLVDRAGIVGSDGATHHGYFDISFLNAVPNMHVACPADKRELKELIQLSAETKSPLAIRYPKGEIPIDLTQQSLEYGKGKKIKDGKKIAVLSTGHVADNINSGINPLNVSWYHFPFVKPFDRELLNETLSKHEIIVTYEHGITTGGFGATVLQLANEMNYQGEVYICAYPDTFISHGSISDLNKELNFSAAQIRTYLQSHLD